MDGDERAGPRPGEPAARRPADEAGWFRQAPPWLRRGVVFALVAVAVFQVAVWAFASLRGFLGLLFLAWLFSISVEPVVERLTGAGLRRGAATGLVLFAVTALAVGFLAVFGTLLVDQLIELLRALPGVVEEVVLWVNRSFDSSFRPSDIVDSLDLTPARVQGILSDLTPGVVGILTALVGLLFQGLTFLLFAYYMSAQGPALRATVSRWFPPRHQRVISTVWAIAAQKTGGYVVSRFLLAFISAFCTGILLWVLGVPFWLPLALWTGVVSQFIPTIGTYLAIGVPALIALAGQPLDAVWVVVFGAVYQQVENYLLGPRITARTVDIHPAVVFGSVIVGAALFGPMGALVSIPVVAAVQAVVETYGRRYELVPAEEADGRADESVPEVRSEPA
ncbi:AI-2E family transporter [Geodermatophilus sp. SYSU D00965]